MIKISKSDNAKSVITMNGSEFKVTFQVEKYTLNKKRDKVLRNKLIGYFCADGHFLALKNLVSLNWIDLSDAKEKRKPVYCIDIQEHAVDYLLDNPITLENYLDGKYY